MTETNTPTPHKATIHTRESHDHRTPHSQQHLQAPQAPKQTPNHPLPKQQHVRRHTPPSKATWAPLPSPTHTKVTYRSYGEHDRVHAPVHSASTKRECLGTRGAYAQGNGNLCKCVANGRLATWPLRQATGDISTTTTYGSKKRQSLTCPTAAAAVMMLLHTLHTASGLSNECQGTITFPPQHDPHTAFKQAGQRCRHRISENLDAQ